jgi:hypothetical protein
MVAVAGVTARTCVEEPPSPPSVSPSGEEPASSPLPSFWNPDPPPPPHAAAIKARLKNKARQT